MGFPYNFDSWSVFPEAAGNSFRNGKISILGEFTGLLQNPNDPEEVKSRKRMWDHVAQFVPPDYKVDEPTSVAIVPMYESQLDTIHAKTEEQEPVAYLAFGYFIKELFGDILPEKSMGVHIVIDSACGVNQTFTYQLDGRDTTFLVRLNICLG